MTQDPIIDLEAPFTSDTLLEVRMGRMKPMSGLKVTTGIDKQVLEGPVRITMDGIVGDEHDLIFHGGVDKAVHGYCSSHYATWAKEFPEAAERFRPGGFGENLVTAHMNERNLCIGDVVAIGRPRPINPNDSDSDSDNGEDVLLEISLPRQPCFKLNHRFGLKNFAPNTWRTHRTGWYYRVLRGGVVRAGDEVRLVRRPQPDWTVYRVQHFLHKERDDHAANEALASMQVLGKESRDNFAARVAKRKAKEKKEAKQRGEEKKKEAKWRDFRIVEKKRQTPRITSFILEAVSPLTDSDEAELDPGAHAKIKLGNGLVRAYSVVDGNRNRFQVAVSFDQETSRGGSRYLHETATVGDVVQVGGLTQGVPIANAAGHHVFVAGGVGVTAFLALAETYKSINWGTTLHYAVRSAEDVPFADRLRALGDGNDNSDAVILYEKNSTDPRRRRLDVGHVVRTLPWNSQLYVCGPRRLMDDARDACARHGVPQGEVHWEAFEADVTGGEPFDAVVWRKADSDTNSSSNGHSNPDNTHLKTGTGTNGNTPPLPLPFPLQLHVGEDESLLEALRRALGDDDDDLVPSSCEVGSCGTCRIGLREGRVDHRGTALLDEDKATSLLACVSRGIGRIIVEI